VAALWTLLVRVLHLRPAGGALTVRSGSVTGIPLSAKEVLAGMTIPLYLLGTIHHGSNSMKTLKRETGGGHMRHIPALILVSLLVAGLGHAAAADSDHLIVPGVGIGPIHLGMNLADVAGILGTPRAAKDVVNVTLTGPPGSRSFALSDTSFVVFTTQEGLVYEIGSPFDPKYALANGLRVGSKEIEVRAFMGEPSRTVPVGDMKRLVYDDKGVMFQIVILTKYTNHDQVNRIYVFEPGAPHP